MPTPTQTLRIIKHTPYSIGGRDFSSVTIPSPPWGDLDIDDRAATKPRMMPVRAEGFDLRKDRVLRHAARVSG